MQVDLGVMQSAIPQLSSAKSALSSCRALISGIVIPADFPEGGKIKAAAGKISDIEGMISSAQSSVSDSINRFNATINKNNSLIDELFQKMMNYDISTNKIKSGIEKSTSKGKIEKQTNVNNGSKKININTFSDGIRTYKVDPTSRKSYDSVS